MSMNVDPSSAMKDYLLSIGIADAVYSDRERPTSGLPDCFIDVMQNGGIRSMSEGSGFLGCQLLIVVYVKLLSTDAANISKEQDVMRQMTCLLSRKVVSVGCYHFKLTSVLSMRNITSGYSSVPMNVDCLIY